MPVRPGRLEELRRQHRARGISGKIFTLHLIAPAWPSSDRLARAPLLQRIYQGSRPCQCVLDAWKS